MDLAVVMRQEVLADKLEEGRGGGRVATWNTRRLPTRLTPGWTNRLFVACHGRWRGYFPLSGDVFWNPRDEAAPYALIFDPYRWAPVGPASCPSFRGWRYLESPPAGAPEVAHHDAGHASLRGSIPPRTS
jgi:hypothetical protein